MSKTIYVGMDVHAATISVAVVEGRGLPRSLGTIENRPEAVRRLIGKLGEPKTKGERARGYSPSCAQFSIFSPLKRLKSFTFGVTSVSSFTNAIAAI
jgi:hypothetical protein